MYYSDEVAKQFWMKQIPVLILKFSPQAASTSDTENVSRIEFFRKEYQDRADAMMNK